MVVPLSLAVAITFLSVFSAIQETSAEPGSVRLTKNQLGDQCVVCENGAVTKCTVADNSTVDFKGELKISVEVKSLILNLKWTGGIKTITNSPVCLKGGSLVVGCPTGKISPGSYPLTFKIDVPSFLTGAKVLSVYVTAAFADGSTLTDNLIGSLEVLISKKKSQ